MRFAPAFWIAVALAAAALPGHADVRKCTDAKGRVTFQDSHCNGDPSAPAATPTPGTASVSTRAPEKVRAESVQPSTGAHGAWRGAAQFRYLSGAPQDASADANLELALLPDGRVQGGALGAGCRFEGLHTPDRRVPNTVAVDITVSGCRDVRFNARYAGQLDATPGRSRLRLHAITAASPVTTDGYRELSMATVDAALRR